MLPGSTLGDRLVGGPAIDKKQFSTTGKCLHDPGHGPWVAGEQTAHVVVQADHMGNGPQALQQGRLEGRFRHMQGQRPGTRVGAIMGGHRKMQHHLLPSLMGLLRKPGGMGGMGQEGVGHLPGQTQGTH